IEGEANLIHPFGSGPMAEARKLAGDTPPELPDIPVDLGQRPRSRDSVPVRPADEGSAAKRLPPLPAGEAAGAEAEIKVPPASALTRSKAPVRRKGGLGRALLILVLVGLASFAGGAGLTAGIVLGNFDAKTGQVKETLKKVKAYVQQLRS